MARSSTTLTGKPGPGRPKGSKNKLTVMAKELFSGTLDGPKITARLIEMRDSSDLDEQKIYWGLFAKMIPTAVDANVNSENRIDVVVYTSGRGKK